MHYNWTIARSAVAGLAGILIVGACSSRISHEQRQEGGVSAAIASHHVMTDEVPTDEHIDSSVGNPAEILQPAEPATSIPTEDLMAYDQSIPLTDTEGWWVLYDDLESLSGTSTLAFVGRIIGYQERIRVVPHSIEVPAVHRGANVYDAIIFAIDEVLVGEDDPRQNAVSVAVRRLILNPDGTARFRVSESPIETVEPGIAARNMSDKPSYIVYVTEDQETYSPFYDSGYYFFNTPGGVAPMLGGERIGYALDRPLARPVVVEDGVYRQIDHGLTLDDARAVGRVVETENTPASDGDSPDPLGDLTPSEPSPVGVVDG